MFIDWIVERYSLKTQSNFIKLKVKVREELKISESLISDIEILKFLIAYQKNNQKALKEII